jgi:hypothetical protein
MSAWPSVGSLATADGRAALLTAQKTMRFHGIAAVL